MSGCASDIKPDEEDWVSVKRLAVLRGVSHQAVSKRVAFFMRKGLLQTRRSGKEKLVHRPTFDALAAASHDSAQDLRLRHVKGEPPPEFFEPVEAAIEPAVDQDEKPTQSERPISAYDDASTREKNAKAALAEMELARRRDELVPARELADAAVQLGTTIAQHVATLKSLSGKLYAAGATGGEEAVHAALAEEVNRVLGNVREGLMKLATEDASEPPARPN